MSGALALTSRDASVKVALDLSIHSAEESPYMFAIEMIHIGYHYLASYTLPEIKQGPVGL